MPSPRICGGRLAWTVLLLALVAVYGVGSVKPQKNIDKKNIKVTNPQALAHLNVKAKFGPRTPSFEATGSTKGKAKGQAWVRSSLSQLKVGNSPLNVTGLNWSVVSNTTDDGSQNYAYSAALDANTSVQHTYGFHAVASQGDFSGLAFNISESAIKWSIQLTTSAPSAGVTLRYALADNASYVAADGDNVTTFYNAPRHNMTTYVLPLTATLSSSPPAFAEMQVFDVALVDDELQAIRHYVEAVPLASGAHQYELVLEFPPFNRSLYYDPSLSLGVLVGDQTGSDAGGHDNTALIVAVTVVVVVAVALVVVAALGGVIYGYRQKTHHKKRMNRVQKTLNKESQLASDRV